MLEAQIEDLEQVGFHYITSITKPQIESLLCKGLFQMELFNHILCEVKDEEEGVRYILRRNPWRAEEIHKSRESKVERIKNRVEKATLYLSEHLRAKVEVQVGHLGNYIRKLKMSSYIQVEGDKEARYLRLKIDKEKLSKAGLLDGCYVIKTDLPQGVASKELVHDRYKALSEVEWASRTQKTGYLQVRPVYVRKKERTVAHLLVVMLAYKMERYLRSAWRDLNITVEEGLSQLAKITSTVITIGKEKLITVPRADTDCQKLLHRVNVVLPEVLPHGGVTVATRKKLQEYRKSK